MPKPGSVRQRILHDHQALRARITEVDALARRTLAEESGLDAELRAAGERLQREMVAHLDLEDRLMLPALRAADAWGEERAQLVEREHREQRAELARILDLLRDGGVTPREVANTLEAFFEALLADMQHEERAMLDGDLLRDDVIGIDVEAG